VKATRSSDLPGHSPWPLVVGLVLVLILAVGCASAPVPPIRSDAPRIPTPPPVATPAVTVPHSTDGGTTYCFTRQDLLEIRDGIKRLEADDALLRQLIADYNAWRDSK